MTPQEIQLISNAISADSALSSQPNTPDGAYAIAVSLNTPTEAGFKPISVASAMLWAASGPRVRIEEAAIDTQNSEVIRASCQVFLDLIISGSDSLIHTEEDAIKNIFSTWLQASIITQSEYDAVYGGTGIAATLLARSYVLIGRQVSYQDILNVRGA